MLSISSILDKAKSFKDYSGFGFKLAWDLSFGLIGKPWEAQVAEEMDLKYMYLRKLLSEIEIKEYPEAPTPEINPTVWFMWWQGERDMPAVTKACLERLKANLPQSWQIVFIDRNNYKKYANIPRIIIEKVNQGNITLTHLSDMIRVNLLATHGGIWCDATILCPGKLDERILSQPFITLSIPTTDRYLSKGRWSGFFMGGFKGHPLFSFINDCFNHYWEKHYKLIDYLLLDYVINLAYDSSPRIREDIDRYAVMSPELYVVQHQLNEPLTDDAVESIYGNPFHKLTWKGLNLNEENTVAKYIINEL